MPFDVMINQAADTAAPRRVAPTRKAWVPALVAATVVTLVAFYWANSPPRPASKPAQSSVAIVDDSPTLFLGTTTSRIATLATTGTTLSYPSAGVVFLGDATPPGAAWHVVTDTYFDENGNVVGTNARGHFVNPLYCRSGVQADGSKPIGAAPLPVRQAIAASAAVDPYPVAMTAR